MPGKYWNFRGKRWVLIAGLMSVVSPLRLLADENDAMEQEMKKAGKTREVNGEEMDQATEKETFKDRLKKSREVAKIPKNEKGGFYLGGNLGVGQTYPAQSGSSPGLSLIAGLEPGMIFQNSSFNRFEMGLKLFTGNLSYNDSTLNTNIPLGIGIMPRFGYGYSLAPGMFGVFSIYGGLAQARLDAKTKDTSDSVKNDPVWGFGFGGGWDMVFEMSDHFEFLAGLSITHYQYNFNSLKVNGNKVDGVDSTTVNMNVPQLMLGARFKI